MKNARSWVVARAVCCLVLLTPHAGFPALLDKKSAKHPVLDAIVDALDKKQIDVARKLDSQEALSHKSTHPVVAPLSGLQPEGAEDAEEEVWQREFREGALGAVTGMQEKKRATYTSGRKFRRAWKKADRSTRIFLSFTKADLPYAIEVKTALEDRGYSTFIYLNNSESGFTCKPKAAGKYFREAGHRFVLDTSNARQSKGVAFEHYLDAKLSQAASSERASRLIKQLGNSDAQVRTKAAAELSAMGKELSRSDVNRIANLMRTGRKKWSKRLYRQSHCTWYENTSIRYYAGRALLTMDSQYVSKDLRQEAARAQSSARSRTRRNDPGWV